MAAWSARRIRRAIEKSNADIRALVASARANRAAGFSLGYRADLEKIRELRSLNANRRASLRAGGPIAVSESERGRARGMIPMGKPSDGLPVDSKGRVHR